MSQLGLFEAPTEKPKPVRSAPLPIVLRDYQRDSVDGVFDAWKSYSSTMVQLPTGCGKSIVFSAVMKRWCEEHA